MLKVHIHVDRGVDRLSSMGAVQDDDGVLEPLDADLLDIDVSFVPLVLYVYHRL
jgi:hypothetical protein